jgi:hypothetical protein
MDRMSYSLLLLVSLCFAILLPACTEPTERVVQEPVEPTPAQLAAHEALGKERAGYERERTNALYLQTDLLLASDVPVSMDWYELETVGVSPYMSIDFSFPGGTLDDAISAVMVSLADEGVLAREVTPEGVIVITTAAALAGNPRDRSDGSAKLSTQELMKSMEWLGGHVGLADLATTLAYVGHVCGTEVRVDWDELVVIGIDRTRPLGPVSQWSNQVVADGLEDALAGAGGREVLGYIVREDGAIVISTVSDLVGEDGLASLTRRGLSKRVLRLHLDDVDIETVFDYVCKVSGANMSVRWHELETVGVDPVRSMVNLDLVDLSLDEALRASLTDVAPEGVLAYEIGDDGVIVISTAADLARTDVDMFVIPAGVDAESPQGQTCDTLSRMHSRFEIADVPIGIVLDYFRETFGLDIRVEWDELATAGVDEESSVEFYLRNVTVSRGLVATLESVAPRGVLAYEVDADGVITISTAVDLADEVGAPPVGESAAE